MKNPAVITLLTDFGTQDTYVGAMKGVILGINPSANIVDLAHDLPKHDILAASFALESAYHFFPAGTIHVAVVDPGVGSKRRALAAQLNNHLFVAPDNGILTPILEKRKPKEQVISLENRSFFLPRISGTFHGRDIYAPVAAHLSIGVKLNAFGPVVTDPVLLPWPKTKQAANSISGEVIHVDRFGNLVTNITRNCLVAIGVNPTGDDKAMTQIGRSRLREIVGSYSQKRRGQLLAIIGSVDRLEIAVREGSAASIHRTWRRGTKVTVSKTNNA